MAARGSKKELSERHENYVAILYEGVRSPSSGAAVTDEGDVRSPDRTLLDGQLFECKGQFGELTGKKPVRSTLLKQFTKLAEEAYTTLREPVMALRFYAPGTLLADNEGWVDLTVRLLTDDQARNARLRASEYRMDWS